MAEPFTNVYSTDYDPAMPVAQVSVSSPHDEAWKWTAEAIIDSGADRSLVPLGVVRNLLDRIPTGHETIEGVTGVPKGVTTLELEYQIGDIPRATVQFIAWGSEMIIGRDILNRLMTVLDGLGLEGQGPLLKLFHTASATGSSALRQPIRKGSPGRKG